MSKSNRVSLVVAAMLAVIGGWTCVAETVRAPVTVKVVDTAGKPIANALVQLTPSETDKLAAEKLSGASFSGLTDEEGSFTAQIVVHDGSYSVVARRAGYGAAAGEVKAPLPPVIAVQLQADAPVAVPPEPVAPPAAPETASPPATPEASVNVAPGAAQAAPSPGFLGMLWLGVKELGPPLVLMLAPLISFFVLRFLSVRLVLYHMMRKSPKGSAVPYSEEAQAAGRPNESAGELEFLNLNNTNGVLLNGSAQERLERAELSGRRSLRPLLMSVLAGFVAWAAIVTGEAIAVPEMRAAAAPAVAAGAVLFLVMLVIAGYGYWHRGRLTPWMSVTVCLLTLAAGVGVWRLAQVPPYLTLLPGIAQGLTAWFLIRRLHRDMLAAGNKHLLILRVFGSDKSTAFTFGTLMDKWRFVGSFLTIVDPSYIRYQFAAISPFQWKKTAAATFWYGLAAAILGFGVVYLGAAFPGLLPESLKTMPPKDQAQMLMNGGYLIMIPLAILPIFLYVTSRFAKSQAEAAERIALAIEDGKQPRRGTFRGLPMWCFDDVWRPSVRQMLSNAQTILMDLRGFTPERKGCAYEIGELIDRFPIGRVLFLVDENSGQEALFALIRERWLRMSADSPNCAARKVVLKVYETNPLAKARQVRKDVTRILALLSACVDENAAGKTAPKVLVQIA